MNMLLPRINSSFMVDTSGGTRHTEHSREVPLITSAFAVLGLHGGRTDLMPLIVPALHELEQAYANPIDDYSEVYRRALGNDVSVIALAADRSNGAGAVARPPLARPTPAKPSPLSRGRRRVHPPRRRHARGGRR